MFVFNKPIAGFAKIILLVAPWYICSSLYTQGADDEDEPNAGLWIETETEKNSAGVTPGQEEEDKKRKNLGLGEKIKVSLNGKAALKGPIIKIEWDITKGLELLEENPSLNGTDTVEFKINENLSKKDIEKSNIVEIKVIKTESNNNLPEPVQFTVIFPEIITGRQIEFMGEPGSTIPDGLQNGDLQPGASAQLKLTVHPLNVNFSNIRIIERDGGFRPNPGSLATKHVKPGIWPGIDNRNELIMEENIGMSDTKGLIEGPIKDQNGNPVLDENDNVKYHSFPNTWTWICLFNTYKYQVGDQGIEYIDNDNICEVDQNFLVDKRNGKIFVKITKHKISPKPENTERCSVERTTKGDHIFKP